VEHGNIISLNIRNMITIIVMATIGWFFLHLLVNLFGGGIGVSYSGSTSGGVNLSDGGQPA
jgi:hypothetical protein